VSYGFTFPTQEHQSAATAAAQLDALRDEVRQLKNAAVSRHEIGIAQGMLMLRDGIDKHQAYALLSERARDQGVHVRAVAQSVLTELGSQPGGPGPPPVLS
jgi:AmiR/NasT family two-component response regulator